jgi:multiple sugar transport system permease protein
LTPAAVGLVWKFFYSYTGLVNFTLELLGFQAVNWFDERNALLSVIIVSIWQHYPLAFLVILAGLQTIPQNIIEAAKIDGASPFQIFINISFPLLRSLIIVILVIRTINLLRYVDLIFTLTHGGPGTATETFSFLIYKKGFELFNMGYGSALSYLLIFLSILITWLYLRLVKAE